MGEELTIYQKISRKNINRKRLAEELEMDRDELDFKITNCTFSQLEVEKLSEIIAKMQMAFVKKRVNNKFGLKSGLTREFSFSRKKRLHDPCTIECYDKKVTRIVREWIEKEPVFIHSLVFKKRQLLLASDSINYLETKMGIKSERTLETARVSLATSQNIIYQKEKTKFDNKAIKEDWNSISGYEGIYEITQSGVVRSLDRNVKVKVGYRFYRGKTLATRVNNSGYFEVRLSKNGQTKTQFIHVLLARTFIYNPAQKPYVNHKNGIKTDNRIENLEWTTHSENIKHAYDSKLLTAAGKQTPVIDICTNKTFSSIKKAADFHSIPYSTCKNYLNGNRKNITCLRYLKNDAA